MDGPFFSSSIFQFQRGVGEGQEDCPGTQTDKLVESLVFFPES